MIPTIPDALLSTSLVLNSISSRATSRAAQYIAEKCVESRDPLQGSVSFVLDASGVFEELWGMYEQCRRQNWDGYGGAAMEEETYWHAWRFLRALPWGPYPPSVGAEADGHLTLEWYLAPRRTLSVSVSPEGNLHYAALVGDAKEYGSKPFSGKVPTAILTLIQQVYSA